MLLYIDLLDVYILVSKTVMVLYYLVVSTKIIKGKIMKNTIKHDTLGEIVYQENPWTGKKDISINGTPLTKKTKNTFSTQDGQEAVVTGNYMSGAKLTIGNDTVEVVPATKWYEYVLSILPFILILVWGNVVALCEIVPVVGGFVGGLISAVISILNLFIIKNVKQVWLKIIISIVALGLAFLLCYLVALAILSMV